jgi:hypothetical protein
LTTVALDKLDKISEDKRNDRKELGGSDRRSNLFSILEPLLRKLKTRTAFSLFGRRDEKVEELRSSVM